MKLSSLFKALIKNHKAPKPGLAPTEKAPLPVGPYSQAFRAGGFLFCSGQIPLKPGESDLIDGDIESQTRQALENLKAVLASANMSLKHTVKTSVFLTDMNQFARFNKIYKSYFDSHRPARSCVEVSALPKAARVEIELIAFKGPLE